MPSIQEPLDPDWPTLIHDALRERDAASTVCPSDVARRTGPGWRAHMQAVRDAACLLAQAGRIRILQRGQELDPLGPWRGAIRLARGARFDKS